MKGLVTVAVHSLFRVLCLAQDRCFSVAILQCQIDDDELMLNVLRCHLTY